MGICPLIGWRHASVNNLLRNFRYPFGVGIALGIVLAIFGNASWLACSAFP